MPLEKVDALGERTSLGHGAAYDRCHQHAEEATLSRGQRARSGTSVHRKKRPVRFETDRVVDVKQSATGATKQTFVRTVGRVLQACSSP